MFGTFALMALAASVSFLVARADVTPNFPGPGVVFREGSTCRTQWLGDKDSPTVWKNMVAALMTGDNFNMIPLTMIAQGLDGTRDGSFTFPCPEVTPNSAIYFLQFWPLGSSTKTWTTRFTIAGPNGETTPPEQSNQPGTNDPIPWGVGALKDPSKAIPLPDATPSVSATAAGSTTPPTPSPTSTSTSAPPALVSRSASDTLTLTSRFTTILVTSTPIVSAPTATASGNNVKANTADNAAMAVTLESRVWQGAVVLTAFAMAFVALL